MFATALFVIIALASLAAMAYVLLNPGSPYSLGPLFSLSNRQVYEAPETPPIDQTPQNNTMPEEGQPPDAPVPPSRIELRIVHAEMYIGNSSYVVVENVGTEPVTIDIVSFGSMIWTQDYFLDVGGRQEITLSNVSGTVGAPYSLILNGTTITTNEHVSVQLLTVLQGPITKLEIVNPLVEVTASSYASMTFTLLNSGMDSITISDIVLGTSINRYLWIDGSHGLTIESGKRRTLNIDLSYEDYVGVKVENPDGTFAYLTPNEIALTVNGESSNRNDLSVSVMVPVENHRPMEIQSTQQSAPPSVSDPSNFSLDEYRQYALSLINEDRDDAGLDTVSLDDNAAAQIHAEDMLKAGHLTHWTTDGMKPYMRYSVYGGTDFVSQNAAFSGFSEQSISQCKSGKYLCNPIDVEKQIERLEYLMMYDDLECCDNGHRDNILDKDHTHVSIGIAYDEFTVFIVQNFENDYLDMEIPDVGSDGIVEISGDFEKGYEDDYTINFIQVFYDPAPTPSTYTQSLSKHSYDSGDLAGFVIPPAGNGGSQCLSTTAGVSGSIEQLLGLVTGSMCQISSSSTQTQIHASEWVVKDDDFRIEFDLSHFVSGKGSGVYTMYLVLKPVDAEDDDFIPVTSYSIFVNQT